MAYRRYRRGMGRIAPSECTNPTSSTWSLTPGRALFCGPTTDCSDSVNWAFAPACWSQSPAAWALQAGAVAPPPAPTGDALTVPPASGADAQATVDALVNQQMIDQQAHNAAGVTSSVSDVILGSGGAAIAAAAPAVPWLWIGLGLLTVFAASVVGGGSPRRYGR